MKRVACILLLLLTACGGLTIGPTIERKAIIVHAGTPIVVMESVTVEAVVMADKDVEDADVFEQEVGGWVMMHPDHWVSVKNEMQRLRLKAGE
jgi:hypothetical protein